MATFAEKRQILESKVTRVPRMKCNVVDWECNGRYFGTAKKIEDMTEQDLDRIARVLEINFDEAKQGQQEKEQRKVERKEKAKMQRKVKEATAVKQCMCGCGGTTKSKFCPGHDSKFKNALRKRLAEGDATAMVMIEQLGWKHLFDK